MIRVMNGPKMPAMLPPLRAAFIVFFVELDSDRRWGSGARRRAGHRCADGLVCGLPPGKGRHRNADRHARSRPQPARSGGGTEPMAGGGATDPLAVQRGGGAPVSRSSGALCLAQSGLQIDLRLSIFTSHGVSFEEGHVSEMPSAMSTFDPGARSVHPLPDLMARIVVIDNYDSFTYNLVQYLETLGASCEVVLNDAYDVGGIASLNPQGIVISPGPCTPDEAGVSLGTVTRLAGTVPILGRLPRAPIDRASLRRARHRRATALMHGKTSPILHDGKTVFSGLPSRSPRRATTRSSWSGRACPTCSR